MKQIFVALATSAVLFACHNSSDQAAIESAKQEAVDSVNNVNAMKQQVIDSMKTAKSASHEHNSSVAATSSSSTAASSSSATTTAKKKGWSHTAKGAVVGAGAGAITGALVNKDHVKGAAIGTLIGAGVGAGTGAIVDHSKKKKQSSQ